MVQRGQDLILIDMADISAGNPIYDIGSFFIGRYMTSDERKEKMLGLPVDQLDHFFERYLQTYLADRTEEQRERFMKQANVMMLLWFCVFLRYSWSATPSFIEMVQGIVRGKLLPQIEDIVKLFAEE